MINYIRKKKIYIYIQQINNRVLTICYSVFELLIVKIHCVGWFCCCKEFLSTPIQHQFTSVAVRWWLPRNIKLPMVRSWKACFAELHVLLVCWSVLDLEVYSRKECQVQLVVKTFNTI